MKKGTINPLIPKSSVKEYNDRHIKEYKVEIKADTTEFIPIYQNLTADWCDLFVNLPVDIRGQKRLVIAPGHAETVDCGFSLKWEAGHGFEVRSTCEMARRGLMARFSPDLDKDGFLRVKVMLINMGRELISLENRDRVAEMSYKPIYYLDFEEEK
jgi:dUTPase